MILLNKFLHNYNPVVIKYGENYKISWRGKLGWAKFSIRVVVAGQVAWINYNSIVAKRIYRHILSTTTTLFLDDEDFVEIINRKNEVIHSKPYISSFNNYSSIHFNINSYLAWNRYKKDTAYRKKILQWI